MYTKHVTLKSCTYKKMIVYMCTFMYKSIAKLKYAQAQK